MSDALIVFSTCATREEAGRIARAVVEERLAACVQLLPPIQSIYRWQGAIEQSEEILMLFKTTSPRFCSTRAAHHGTAQLRHAGNYRRPRRGRVGEISALAARDNRRWCELSPQ